MCKAYSFIAVRYPGSDRPEFRDSSRGLDRHSAIIEEAGICAYGESRVDICKLEWDMYSDAPALDIDEPSRPEWFDLDWEDRARSFAIRRIAAFRTLKGEIDEIKEGNWRVDGERHIRLVSGGYVRSLDSSTLSIETVSGGDVGSWELSTLSIETVSGGYVRSFGSSTLSIETVSGGYVRSFGSSTLSIETVSGGDVSSWESSTLSIETDRRNNGR